MLTKYKNVINNILLISLMITFCLFRISIIKSIYWIFALILAYYTLAYKTSLTKFDEIMQRIEPKKRLKSLKIIISLFTALSIIFKLTILFNYWLTVDQFSDGILYKSEFLQIEIFGEKLTSKPAFNEFFIGMKYFIFELVIENLILIFTIISACYQFEENNHDQQDNKEGENNSHYYDINANYDPIRNEEKHKERMNSSIIKKILTGTIIKKQLKSFNDEKLFFFSIQLILLSILTLFNISLMNIPIFATLILIMTFAIFFPNTFNSLDVINKIYGNSVFLILTFVYTKNSILLKNIKDDYFLGVVNFDAVNSYSYFVLLVVSYLNSCCIQYYDITDADYNKIDEAINKRIIEEYNEEVENNNMIEMNNEKIDLENPNYSDKIKNLKDSPKKLESDLNLIGQIEEEDATFFISLKKLFFLISPLLYKVILLIWILFHVCLIMFINFVILFFAIEKAKKYFKLNYLIPSFLVCVLFTTLQYSFNMNGLLFFENIRTYKILEIIGIYKIFKNEITDFASVKSIDNSNETKFFGMLFNVIAMNLLFYFGLAMSVSSEDEQISASKKRDISLKEKEANLNNDVDISANVKIENSDKKIANEDNKNIISNNIIIEDINNFNSNKSNPKTNSQTKLNKLMNLDENDQKNLQFKEKILFSKLKVQLVHFWIEKSYLLCIIITFMCSVIKFDLLHVIYFMYFIVLLCLGDKGFKPVWDNLMLINRIIIIIILYFWNILAVNFLDLEKETNPEVENIFTYLGLKINKNSIFFVEYYEHIILYLFGYLHNYSVVYLYIYFFHNDNRNNINISLENSLNSSYLENEKIASVKHIYRFPEWTRKITLFFVILLMVELAFIRPLSFQGLFIFILSLIFLTANLFIMSKNKKDVIRGLIKTLIIISIISIVLKYCINFSFLVNYLKDLFNLEDVFPLEEKSSLNYQNMNRLSSTNTEEENLNYYILGGYSNDSDNPNLKNFSLQDFGLDVKNFKFKLFVNFLMILFMKILYSYSYYHDEKSEILNMEEKNEEGLSVVDYLKLRIKNTQNSFILQFREIYSFLKVFCCQIIFLHSCKMMFLVSVFICVSLESMIGVILFGVILISLFMERKTGWKYSFFPLILISMMVMSFIYICKMNAFKKWMTKDYEWFGLYNPKSNSILFEELPYIIILFISYLSRISAAYKDYFTSDTDKERLYNNYFFDKSIDSSNKKDGNEKNNVNTKESNFNSEKNNKLSNVLNVDGNLNNLEKNEGIEEKQTNKNPNAINEKKDNEKKNKLDEKEEQKEKDESLIKMTFEDEPRIQFSVVELNAMILLSKFWIKIDFFWYLYGFYIVLITIMLIAFIKVNLLSLIFMTFVGIQSFGVYVRTEFRTEKEDNNKENLIKIRKNWSLFAIFLAIFSFFQYINYMWFPPSWKIQKPWEHLSFICSREGKSIYSNNVNYKNNSDFDYCVADWKAWLNIDNYSTKDIFFNFICLFLLLISEKYFTGEELPYKPREKFHPEKSNNFTIAENRKTFWDTLTFVSFIYLKSFILFCVIIMSIIYSYKYTNIIYGGFMFISFYLLFKDAVLTKQKNELWIYVQYYNFAVLVAFMLFQTPLFPCPINRDGRSYVGLEECVDEENKLYKTFLLFEYPKYLGDALYMMLVQTVGLLKLDFKLLILGNLSLFLIYIVALIQQIIFDHPYQEFVDKYLDVEKNINSKSRAFKIVQDSHLNIKCEYRKIHSNIEILNDKLQRLNRRTTEYADLWNQTNQTNIIRKSKDTNSGEFEFQKNDVDKKKIRLTEDIDILIENTLNENDLAGDVDYQQVKTKVKEIRNKLEKEGLKENLKKSEVNEKKIYDQEIKEDEEKKKDELSLKEVEQENETSKNLMNGNKFENEENEEKIQLIHKKEEKLNPDNKGGNISQSLNLNHEEDSEMTEEEKLKNEIIENLITELGKLMAIQRRNDKFFLYKSHDHGLEIALPVYEKIIKNAGLENFNENELAMLKILFPNPDEKNIEIILGENNDRNTFHLSNNLNLTMQQEKNLDFEKKYILKTDDKSGNRSRSVSISIRDETISNFLNNKNNNNFNDNKTNLSSNKFSEKEIENLNKSKFDELKDQKEPQTVSIHSNSKLNFKANSDFTGHPNINLIKNKIQSKYYPSILSNDNIEKTQERNLFEWIYYKFQKSIDKILLIDLASSSIYKPDNIFEVFLYWIYSKIENLIIIVFIINICVDASVISMVYPISYFGYALLEYPFTNKYYWKTLTVYSLVTITLKLVYQFPFFCGYPFLSIFNLFNDNYCEPYNLSETDFLDNFEYFLGFRKYNGEYSYPKNAGLLSGILWDIIILFLLLCNRSLLKSKGIWNFIDIHKEFTKVPVFLNGKNYSAPIILTDNDDGNIIKDHNTNEIRNKERDNNNLISNNIQNSNNNPNLNHDIIIEDVNNQNRVVNLSLSSLHIKNELNNNIENNRNNISLVKKNKSTSDVMAEYYDSLFNFIKVFFRRLAPELYYTENNQISKPGVDYYPHTFACLLIILIYTLLFFGSITGRNGQSFSDILDKQQFSKDLVWTTIIIIIVIVFDRMIYKFRSVNTDFIFERLNIKKKSNKNVTEKKVVNHSQTRRQQNPNRNYNSQNSIVREQSNFFNQYFEQNTDVDYSNYALIAKLIMHYTILLFVHYFIFIKLPLITRIYFFQNYSLMVLYVLCCIYFYLTSMQIKYGFPLITKGQYFASSTSLYNRIAFKIYRNVPFLYELRAILDWTITKTSLDLFQWFKMEDAYANLYEVKCDMVLRKDRRKGEDRLWYEKFGWGFCFFISLMFVLVFPMILFSSFNPNLVENKVLGGKFSVNLELKNPELDVTTFTLNLFQVSTLKINKIKNPSQYTYLKNTLIPQVDDVEERKIQKVKIINYSQLDWILSPPTIRELLTNLEKKSECFINIEWEFRREFPPNNRNIVGFKSNQLTRDQISTLRYIIFSLKTHQKPEKFKLDIKDAFPKIIRLANKQSKYLKFDSKHKTQHREYTDIQLQLIKENERDIYWKINQVDIKNMTDSPFYNKNDELSFILINDDVISSFFGFNSDGGMPLSIIGIYATLVYTVGKFIRIFFDKISQRVIYEEMPEPNDLFELCEGIYIYRNQRNLEEENRLYDLLIRIYRSPETLIKITGTNLKENGILKEENKTN